MKTPEQIAEECISHMWDCSESPEDSKRIIIHAINEAVTQEREKVCEWKPIETAPTETDILVMGDSGYVTYRTFYTNAHYCTSKDAWVDATGTRLTDNGWRPTHWMHIPNCAGKIKVKEKSE